MLAYHVLPKKLPNSGDFPHWRQLWLEELVDEAVSPVDEAISLLAVQQHVPLAGVVGGDGYEHSAHQANPEL